MWDRKCLSMRRTASQPCMKGESSAADTMAALTLPPLPKPKHALPPCCNICGHGRHTPMLKNTWPFQAFFYVLWPAFYHLLSFNKWVLWWKKSWIEQSLPTLSQNCQYLAGHKMSHPALPGYHPAHCNKKKALKICTLPWLLLPQPRSKTKQSIHQYKRQKIPPRADLRVL